MASEITNYKCPGCGGPLHFAGQSQMLECDYCGGKYTVEQVEEMLKAENEKAIAAGKKNDEKRIKEQADMEAAGFNSMTPEGMKSYSCPSCGAELICDSNTAATCCPYCGNQTIIPGQFTDDFSPEFVIPFKTDKKQAKAALLKHYEDKKLLPDSFINGNHIEDIQGVYVPFWMIDGKASGPIEYECATVEEEKKRNETIITKTWYHVFRDGEMNFEMVPADASSKMPDYHMDSIEPYDYSELKPFNMAYMPGFLADKYDVTVPDCENRVKLRCENTYEAAVDSAIKGYDIKNQLKKNLRYEGKGAHYAMLPVWLLATKWENQNFLFAMNGQTGKLVGDLPIDKKKSAKYFWLSTLITFVVMFLMYLFLQGDDSLGLLAATFIVPFIIGAMVVGSLKAKMKSVFQGTAAQSYIDKEGLKLSVQEDVYVRQEVERKKND